MYDAEIAEFNNLRQEILFNFRSILQLFMFAIVSVAGLFSYGLTSQNGYVFLGGPVVVCASLLHATSYFSSVVRIATYIRCVLEERVPGLNWECFMYGLRSAPTFRWRFLRLKRLIAAAVVHNVLAVGCAIAAITYGKTLIVLPILILLLAGVVYANIQFLNVTSRDRWLAVERFVREREKELAQHNKPTDSLETRGDN